MSRDNIGFSEIQCSPLFHQLIHVSLAAFHIMICTSYRMLLCIGLISRYKQLPLFGFSRGGSVRYSLNFFICN